MKDNPEMTEPTPLDLVKAQKQAHAQEILTAISATLTIIENRPELWFGGTPSTFTNIKNHLEFTATQLSQTFEIEWTSPTAPQPTP